MNTHLPDGLTILNKVESLGKDYFLFHGEIAPGVKRYMLGHKWHDGKLEEYISPSYCVCKQEFMSHPMSEVEFEKWLDQYIINKI